MAAGGDGYGTLPEDQVFEMLTRVPLDDLAACRMVSSRWRRLTYEPGFARLHCRRAGAVSGYFVQSMTRNRYSADFVSMHSSSSPDAAKEISLGFLPSAHVRVVAVAAHRGLVCCAEADTTRRPRYYVCKPATRQWRALPNPPCARLRAAATAMAARPSSSSSSTAEFKIVRLSVPRLRDRLRCEVFDSRRGFAWRRCADVPLPPHSLDPAAPAVRAHGGAVHWLRWPDRLTGAQDVFAFDMDSEAWRLIPLPPEVEEIRDRDPWARKMIAAVENRLCLLVTMDDDQVMEVWEMASYEHGRWAKKTTVSLKRSLHKHECRTTTVLRDLSFSDVAFLDSFYSVMWFDLWRGKMAQVQINHKCVQEVFKFDSDLVPCHIGGRRRRPPSRIPWKETAAYPAHDDIDKFNCYFSGHKSITFDFFVPYFDRSSYSQNL